MIETTRPSVNIFRCFSARLTFALTLIFLGLQVQAQNPATKEISPESVKPSQLPQDRIGSRRIQAQRIDEQIKIDGPLTESAQLTSALMQLNAAGRISAINLRLRYSYRPKEQRFLSHLQPDHRHDA